MSDVAITVEGLSKAYLIGLKEEVHDTLTGALLSWTRAPIRNFRRLQRLNTFDRAVQQQRSAVAGHRTGGWSAMGNGHSANGDSSHNHSPEPEAPDTPADILWALRDVSFEVRRGEVVGIIGRNGAGKSTLLKILSRITDPTCGRAVIHGRVSSLLEVGTGFHPELTGRENVYMNGTILGMRKREIDRKFDEIAAFSGVEKFLDTPVKRYSSGMKVRLAFAVAAHLEPEILVIDEVLAVGDAEFQKKCLGKMQDVASGGRTVLFVSHNMAAVESLCDRVACLAAGRLVETGPTVQTIRNYINNAHTHSAQANLNTHVSTSDRRQILLREISLIDESGQPTVSVPVGSDLVIRVVLANDRESPRRALILRFDLRDAIGNRIASLNSNYQYAPPIHLTQVMDAQVRIRNVRLAPGSYTLDANVCTKAEVLDSVRSVLAFDILPADVYRTCRPISKNVGIYWPEAEWSVITHPELDH